MSENTQATAATEPTQATRDNEPGKQLTLHEAQVQACMCINRILYLTQDPEIKSFFVSYVAGFSDFDAGYRDLVQGLLTDVAPAVGMQISKAPDATPLAWAYESIDDADQAEVQAPEESPENAPSAAVSLRP
jgi:hypothetical protein